MRESCNMMYILLRCKSLSLTYCLAYVVSGTSLLSLAVWTITKMKDQAEVTD